MHSLNFGGISSATLGVYISGSGVYTAPERSYEFIEVPGRDGELLGPAKRLMNVIVTYPCFFYGNLTDKATELKSKFLAKTGYNTLTDTYDTTHFRKGVFVGGTKFKPTKMLDVAEFDLEFSCKPQKWLNSGETKTTLTADGTITNPTVFSSQPLITVYGYGDLYIGSQKITILDVFASISIDCEMGDCYSGTENGNTVVQLQGNEFPILAPGSNSISLDATMTKVEITPRWYEL